MSTCTVSSRELDEPLAATAATARTWLLIEQPGPWGVDALRHSRLDAGLGADLSGRSEGTGVRVALIRRPGPHAHRSGTGSRRVFAAHTVPGRSWIRSARLDALDELWGLDLAGLGAGRHSGLWEPHRGDPLALVCTNGKRDRCCAVLGRPLAAELAASGDADVWEVTHIGGHRFSPTLVVLPHGYAYGRADAPLVKEVLTALRDGHVVTGHCRGRSCWERPGQAAELAVRDLTGEPHADALTVTGTRPHSDRARGAADLGDAWAVTVSHRDGRSWRVNVVAAADRPPIAASCGAALTRQPPMEISAITALTPVSPAASVTSEASPASARRLRPRRHR
ncbi:sucrase ferredoxin [Streptomyces sp. 549]|uniref:sucrase ferredoxin n=1 Tax=Streptomyces sp. 549 TaxID=3049076 RepID=UPI0024C43B4F|nr:sucrase ferredoxin [Streptomyces sp. 549]MDK1475948.1 sucrase ferredoxin [Streptomyces sp. 549]